MASWRCVVRMQRNVHKYLCNKGLRCLQHDVVLPQRDGYCRYSEYWGYQVWGHVVGRGALRAGRGRVARREAVRGVEGRPAALRRAGPARPYGPRPRRFVT